MHNRVANFPAFCVLVSVIPYIGVCSILVKYEDDVLEAVFGAAEDLKDEAAQDSLVALVALPGYFVAVALIGRMGPRRVQVKKRKNTSQYHTHVYIVTVFSLES